MIRAIVVTLILLANSVAHGQLLRSFPQTNPGARIFEVVEDSTLNIAYVCGNFTSLGGINTAYLAAVDLNTNTVIPTFQPFFQCNGAITNLVKVNNYIYFGGTFTSLNNNSTTPYLARLVISPQGTTGTYDFTWIKGASAPIRSIKNSGTDVFILGDHLVIDDGSDVRLNLAKINGANGLTQNWDPSSIGTNPTHHWGSMEPRDLMIRFNKVFIAGKDLRPFNTSGISCFDISSGQFIPFEPVFSFPAVIDLEYLNGKIYAINSKFWPAGYSLLEIDENSYAVSSGAIPINNGNPYGLATYKNSLFVSGNYTTILNSTRPFLSRIEISSSGKFLNNWSSTLNNALNEEKSIHRIRDHLYICGATLNQTNGTPTQGIAQFCLEPFPINGFQTAQLNVCQGEENIVYTCSPSRYADNYYWGFSGTGASFHPNGNTTTISFSGNASSGSVYVVAENECGLYTDTLFLPITVNPTPTANAGPDSTLTCTRSFIDLLGNSNMVPISYSWKRPDGMILIQQNIPAINPGNYVLQVTDLNHGCSNRDTVVISMDTLKPQAFPDQLNYVLTCSQPSQIASGSSIPASAQSWWRKYNGAVYSNPFVCDTIGNYFLIVQDQMNGCMDSTAVSVTENKNPPSIQLLSHSITIAPVDTLTCFKDSLWLVGGTNGTAYCQWITTDTLVNDSIVVTLPGNYHLQTVDSSNGCKSDLYVQIDQWVTPPVFQLQDTLNKSCDVDSVELPLMVIPVTSQISNHTQTIVSTPLYLSQPGWYLFSAQHPLTGCRKSDSTLVVQLPTWNFWPEKDTVICEEHDLSLYVPGNFSSLLWSDQSTGNSVNYSSPVPDTIIIEAIGTNGCYGKDTLIAIKQSIAVDSISVFSNCEPNHPQVTIETHSQQNNLSYQLDNVVFLSSSLTMVYSDTLEISLINPKGCRLDTTLISPPVQLPQIDFLLASIGSSLETFALVNLSYPIPDSFYVSVFPNATIAEDSELPLIIFPDTGSYEVRLHIQTGDCYNELSKTVTIRDEVNDRTSEKWQENISVFPNPFSNSFNIQLSLTRNERIILRLTDLLGKELYYHSSDGWGIDQQINTSELPIGPLFLMIQVGDEQAAIRMIHAQ